MALKFLNNGYFAGTVGIGTDSPVSTWLSGFDPSTGNGTFKLTSEGWIVTPYLTGLAGYYPGQGARPIVWADDSGTNLQCWDNSATDGISLRSSNGTTRLFVKENGNVGIGTTSPGSRRLSVVKDTGITTGFNDIAEFLDTTIGGGGSVSVNFGRENSNKNVGKITFKYSSDGSSNNSLNLGFYGADDLVTLLADGNLGIGETSPDTALDVVGGNADSVVDTLTLKNDSTGNSAGVGINFVVDGVNDVVTAAVYGQRTGSAYHQGSLKFLTRDSLGGGLLERMRIDSTGNVGIGYASPSDFTSVGADNLVVGPLSGNNGITVNSATTGYGALAFADGTDASGQYRGLIQYNHTTNSLALFTNASTSMTILSGGNVGIGTTSPQSKLQANGGDGLTVTANDTAYSQGYFGRIQSDYGTNPLRLVSRSGDVFRATAFGAAVSILTGPTSGTSEKLRITSAGGVSFGTTGTAYGTSGQILKSNGNASPTWVAASTVIGGPYLPLAGGTMTGDIQMSANSVKFDQSGTRSWDISPGSGNLNITSGDSAGFVFLSPGISVEDNAFIGGNLTIRNRALINQQENTDVDTGAETVANVAIATYTAAFFDFVIKKTTNVRSGTVYACHDGTNVEFTETSTQDLGDTSDVTLSVDISGGNMRLLATVTSDDWSVKSLIRAI